MRLLCQFCNYNLVRLDHDIGAIRINLRRSPRRWNKVEVITNSFMCDFVKHFFEFLDEYEA